MPPPGSPPREAVVIGGGLAGMAAAERLATTHRVTLVEAQDELGGQLAGGWRDGRPDDLGVHGAYPRYEELLGLLARAGVGSETLLPAGAQHVVVPSGRASRIRMAGPAPLHALLHSVALPVLAPGARLNLLRASSRLLALSPDDPELDATDLRSLGAALGMREPGFRVVLEPLAWIGFFLAPEELSAAAYLSALRFMITGRGDSWRARWIASPNGATVVRALRARLEHLGVRVLTRSPAAGLTANADRLTGVRLAAAALPAEVIVCAAPPAACARLVEYAPGGAAAAAALRSLGACSVKTLRYRLPPGPPSRLLHGVRLTSAGGFVFFCLDRFMPAYRDRGERIVELQCETGHASAEGDRLADWVRSLYADAPRLMSVDAVAPIPYARYAVGSAADRPGVRSPWPNLFFAGDWVAEAGGRWFMERAVTTGRAAAAAAQGVRIDARHAPLDGPGVRAARALLRVAQVPSTTRPTSASVAGSPRSP
jgi:carotenoid phi-ring synthase / carotenoid chi-ring synthase